MAGRDPTTSSSYVDGDNDTLAQLELRAWSHHSDTIEDCGKEQSPVYVLNVVGRCGNDTVQHNKITRSQP